MPLGDTPTIDGLILDYLLHHCISALLLEWGVQHNQHEEENSPHVPLNETSCAQVKQEVAKKADRSLLLVNCKAHTVQTGYPQCRKLTTYPQTLSVFTNIPTTSPKWRLLPHS